MIKNRTVLNVADNSGAIRVTCIGVAEVPNKKTAHQGDALVVSISRLRNKSRATSKVIKGKLEKAYVARVKRNTFARDGFYHSFDSNSCFIVSASKSPLGTRLFGVIPSSFRKSLKVAKNLKPII